MIGIVIVLLALGASITAIRTAHRNHRPLWPGIVAVLLIVGGVVVAVVGAIVTDTSDAEADALAVGIILGLVGIGVAVFATVHAARGDRSGGSWPPFGADG